MITQQVNLYHPIFRKQHKRFSAKAMVQAGAGVVLGTLLMYGYAWWQTASLRHQVAQATAELDTARSRLETFNNQLAARHVDPRLAQEARDLELRANAAERVGQLLAGQALAGSSGYSKYFVAFARQHVSGVWLTGFSVTGAGEDVTLNGRTANPELVPRFLQQLSREEALSGVRFEVFQLQRPAKGDKGETHDYVEFVVKTSDERGLDKSAKKP